MTTRFFRLMVLLVVTMAGSCANNVSDESLGMVRAAASIPNSGFIPFPVFANTTTPAWDGTLVDLMAADAWMECDSGFFDRQVADDAAEADDYLAHLIAKMSSAACAGTQFLPATGNWLLSRVVHPECNVDAATSQPTTLSISTPDFSNYDISGLGVPTNVSVLVQVFHETKRELAVAAVNLCMAQRLTERLATADSLFASTEQQIELLEVIRQRAQLSMVQYSLLALATAQNDIPSGFVVNGGLEVLPFVHAWGRRLVDQGGADAIGNDFAAAIKLHMDSTRSIGDLLLRAASARSDTRQVSSPADRDWGLGSARHRLLALNYGGDPLNGFSGLTFPWGAPFPGVFDANYQTLGTGRFVTTSSSAPEVDRLLGLSRVADALYFKITPTPVGPGSGLVTRDVVDTSASATQLYRAVEAQLQRQECHRLTPGAPCAIDASSGSIPPTSQFEQYLLYQRHRITPDHATTLVSSLNEAMPKSKFVSTVTNAPRNVSKGTMHFTGQHQIIEDISSVLPGQTGPWYHLDPQFAVVRSENALRAPAYMSYRGVYLPTSLAWDVTGRVQGMAARWQGFVPPNNVFVGTTDSDNANLRYMGAVPALAGVRSLILAGLAKDSSLSTSLYSAPLVALDGISAAIGTRSLEVRPILTETTTTSCPEYASSGSQPASCNILQHTGGNVWEVSIVTRPEDPMHQLVPITPVNGIESTAALDPNFRSFNGYTRATLDALPRVNLVTTSLPNGWEKRTAQITYRGPEFISLFLTDTTQPGQYAVLADTLFLEFDFDNNFPGGFTVPRSVVGKYLSPGGFLGANVTKTWSTLSHDWSQPGFDGFGLPVNFVPPYDAELLGDHPTDTTAQFYLGKAQVAADDATAAVRSAVDGLLTQASDAVALQVAQQRAATIDNLEEQSLCGQHVDKCNTTTTTVDLASLLPSVSCSALYCSLLQFGIRQVVPNTIVVAQAVKDTLSQNAAPSFSDYDGGSIQRILIEQWTAAKNAIHFASDAASGANARSAEVAAANAALQATNDTTAFLCSEDTLKAAYQAGFGFNVGDRAVSATYDEDHYAWSATYASDNTSWSSGSLVGAWNACKQAQMQLAPAVAQSAAVVADAWSWVSSELTQGMQIGSDIRLATSDFASEIEKTKIAKASAGLEDALTTAQTTTRLGFARRFQSYDVWRAQALLENARRLAVTARRAIEATFVVNMSQLDAPEAFVKEPAQWSDEIYANDLNAPAAVGLQTPVQIAGAIYPNKLSDYVKNLDLFVQGYAVTRPTASAKPDTELVTLPGPEQVIDIPNGTGTAQVLSADASAWQFFCDATGQWIAHPGVNQVPITSKLAQACNGGPPSKARIAFSLDAWGRFNGDITQVPFTSRYNVRWRRLAVNVVGTGVRDCSKAVDSQGCFGNLFFNFDLRHTGPAWVTDFDNQWRVLGVPTGVIESGKALAAEVWLDPVSNGIDTPLASTVARTEYIDRPMGGSYLLEFAVTPEIRLDRIERIQILTESNYWAKQQ